MISKTKSGFTLVELLITMAILASVMAMLVPMVVNRLGTKKMQSQVMGVMSEMAKGYAMSIRENGIVVPGATRVTQITRFINYVRIVRTGEIQVLTGANANEVSNSACNNTTPCLLLQNGGYLQYGVNAIFPMTDTTHLSAIVFNFDPDGPDIQPATTFILYENGRITTSPWVLDTNTTVDNTNSPAFAPFNQPMSDPEYIWSFSYETEPTS